ncbi:MAG: sigma-70 family RNA polymerase sigma factor [Acidobacteriota bacterium]
MDQRDPDATLMIAFQDGNEEAFDHLLDKYQGPIVNFIYKFVNNTAEAEELAQEVFLRVYRARHRYQPKARFAAWIYRIAANLSIKEADRKRRMHFWSHNYNSAEDSPAMEEHFRDPAPDAERRLISTEMGQVIRRAIRSLPRNEKIALVLRRYQELSYKEIAEIMDCTEAAVKTYIHRGKLHVRTQILPYLQKG